MERLYEHVLRRHLAHNRQMAFLPGPRQAGKTTTAQTVAGENGRYFNWDRQEDRRLLIKGTEAVAERARLNVLTSGTPVVVFDEIHKYSRWKTFLKGFFDSRQADCHMIVTGSARLNVYRRGGDSLMGRYFPYRMHPLSVAELVTPQPPEKEIRQPGRLTATAFNALRRFGGFPEPFLKGEERFYNRWRRLRSELLINEDVRDVTRVSEIAQMGVLAELLRSRAGGQLNLSSLALDVNCSVDTIRRWIAILESLYYCFTVRPWSRNIAKSLRKQPKIYLWDWADAADKGAGFENMIASHLLKAVHYWTDAGMGDFGLYYLRDKQKREVDFLVARDGVPWFLVEAKSGGLTQPPPALEYFQRRLSAAHAFAVSGEAEYVEADCFAHAEPVVVPALTFLSQLV
ncbi:MAG: ATP-binding protein [Chitinispirillaceae bacterium]|nr:ATP-binding protein [Chitinispirillaceae bacterium]